VPFVLADSPQEFVLTYSREKPSAKLSIDRKPPNIKDIALDRIANLANYTIKLI
jgi:hypothetical protein